MSTDSERILERAERVSDGDSSDGLSTGLLAGGGLVGGLLASTCCVVPFVLFSLGVGGAWLGQLTALASYKPWFLAAGAVLVLAGVVSTHRRSRACRVDGHCAPPRTLRIAQFVLGLAAVLLLLSALWPVLFPLITDS